MLFQCLKVLEAVCSMFGWGRANHYEGFGYKQETSNGSYGKKISTKTLTVVSRVMWYENNISEI